MSKEKSAYPPGSAPPLAPMLTPEIYPEDPDVVLNSGKGPDEIPPIGDDWVPTYDDNQIPEAPKPSQEEP